MSNFQSSSNTLNFPIDDPFDLERLADEHPSMSGAASMNHLNSQRLTQRSTQVPESIQIESDNDIATAAFLSGVTKTARLTFNNKMDIAALVPSLNKSM